MPKKTPARKKQFVTENDNMKWKQLASHLWISEAMVSKIRTSNKNKTDSELTDTLLSKSNEANSIKDNSEKHNQTVNKSKLDIIDELSSNELNSKFGKTISSPIFTQ